MVTCINRSWITTAINNHIWISNRIVVEGSLVVDADHLVISVVKAVVVVVVVVVVVNGIGWRWTVAGRAVTWSAGREGVQEV